MGDVSMPAVNVVRFRVKPGREEEFLNAHRNVQADWPGLKKVNMIKSGDRSYCIIGEWAEMTDLVAARPKMIATLDSFRDTLEDLGGDLGSGQGGIESQSDSLHQLSKYFFNKLNMAQSPILIAKVDELLDRAGCIA